MRLMGLFYVRNRGALANLGDAPCHILGRHALCCEGCATDGGAIACLLGRLRERGDLVRRLMNAGCRVPPEAGDADLVLLAYRLWGAEYPLHIFGAAATAVIDQDAGRLVLSRDRMGEQPLFYATKGSAVAFADHPLPLLESGLAARAVDREGLGELFGLGPARTPGRTPLRDVRSLEPGCYLAAEERGQRIVRYFTLEARPHEDDEARTIETTRGLVARAVEETLPLEPASMLSGGLDSTYLTFLLQEKRRGPVDTFALDYEDNARYFEQNAYQIERDAPYADQAAQILQCRHRTVILPVKALSDALADAVRLRGFPGMADIDSSLLLFGREIAKERDYVLSGECGDEVFGGYPWFTREDLLYCDGFPWSGSLALRERVLNKPVREKLRLPAYVSARYHAAVAALPVLAEDAPAEAKRRQMHGLCFQWFMPNLQERAAQMCAGSGLRVLTPYCDERLAQYVYNVPWAIKTVGGMEKGLLREAARGLLPDELRLRKKSPYPKTCHPAYAQTVSGAVMRMLDDPNAPINRLLDREAITALMASSLSPAETPWFGQLMAGAQMLAYLWQVNAWMEMYGVEIDL